MSDMLTGNAGRVYRRTKELEEGYAIIGDSKVRLEFLGIVDYPKGCGQCNCRKAKAIRIHLHKTHYGKLECLNCAWMLRWVPKPKNYHRV